MLHLGKKKIIKLRSSFTCRFYSMQSIAVSAASKLSLISHFKVGRWGKESGADVSTSGRGSEAVQLRRQ